jgi:hypothetical protein
MIAASNGRLPRTAAIVTVEALLGALLVAPAANAQEPPAPPRDPGAAVTQYRESIPGATGTILTGAGTGSRAPLEAAVSRRLARQGGVDAGLLTQIATSRDYGAPQSTARAPHGEPGVPRTTRRSAADAQTMVSAAVGALSHGGWRVLGLGVFMIAAASLIAAGRRGGQPASGPQR